MNELAVSYMNGKVPNEAQIRWVGEIQEGRERYYLGTPGCGKSTALIAEVNRYCMKYAGSTWLLARYTETEAASVLKGDFERETARELLSRWDHEERRWYYRNGSSVYIHGLKPAEGQAPFCVAPETLVCTADLRWIPAETLRTGDRLLGVEERPPGRSKRRRLVPSEVRAVVFFDAPRLRIVTDRGEIIVSEGHPFLAYKPTWHRHLHWVRADALTPGMELIYLTAPWGTELDGDAAWLGGLLDGEGCLAFRDERLTAVAFAQSPGIVLERAREVFSALGVTYSERMTGPRRQVCELRPAGVGQALQILGRTRPIRLRARFDRALVAGHINLPANRRVRVLAIEHLGCGPLVGLETSTATYIANGLPSHNSKFAGYNLSGVAVSQVEALPSEEWVGKLRERLRHANPPRLLLAEGNIDVNRDHWLFKLVDASKVLEDKRLYVSGPRMILVGSLDDNARNLPVEFVEGLKKEYPVGHPQYWPKVGGWFGPGESGDPVYGPEVFQEGLHIKPVEYDPKYPLLEAWDFGIARPAVLWSQFLPGPRFLALGEWMGNDTPLGDAAREVRRLEGQWFPQAKRIYRTADPAGLARKDVGPSSMRFLQQMGIGITAKKGANTPIQRTWAIQQVREMLQKRVGKDEAFQVHPRCQTLAEGLRFGYKRDRSRVDGMPVKDGWWDHLQNDLEYTFIAFYGMSPQVLPDGTMSVKAFLTDRESGEPKDKTSSLQVGY